VNLFTFTPISANQPRQFAISQWLSPGLARRAVLESAVGEGHFADRVAADRARQTSAGVHRQTGPFLTFEPGGVLPDRPGYRVEQHPPEGIVQPIQRVLR
jgi:hypothetical protein